MYIAYIREDDNREFQAIFFDDWHGAKAYRTRRWQDDVELELLDPGPETLEELVAMLKTEWNEELDDYDREEFTSLLEYERGGNCEPEP